MSLKSASAQFSGALLFTLLAACSQVGTEMADANAAATDPSACKPRAMAEQSPAGLEQAVICLGQGTGAHAITVELATSAAEQQRGLMYRTELAADRGMLFPFASPRPASFWMRNTLIPLDMVFVTPDGTVESIIADVPPQTLDPRRSQGSVAAVLELAAGRAAQLGLEPGDRVEWPR